VWADSIRDADTVFYSYFKYCHQAKEMCALYRKGDREADIEDRFRGVMNKIKDNPITIIEKRTKTPLIISHSDLRRALFSTLYSPTQTLPLVAWVSNILYEGNTDILSQIFPVPPSYDLKPLCAPPLPIWLYPNEAPEAIMCSDKRYPVSLEPLRTPAS